MTVFLVEEADSRKWRQNIKQLTLWQNQEIQENREAQENQTEAQENRVVLIQITQVRQETLQV